MATLYMHTNLTPPSQREADASRFLKNASKGARHFEYEGSDWKELSKQMIQYLSCQ